MYAIKVSVNKKLEVYSIDDRDIWRHAYVVLFTLASSFAEMLFQERNRYEFDQSQEAF